MQYERDMKMQIQKVQSNQPNFGTRVQVDSRLVKIWQKDAANAKMFSNLMSKLENNGKKDVMDIRYRLSWDTQDMAIVNVYEIKDGDIFVSKEVGYDALSWVDGGKRECVALDEIYEECRRTMKQIKNDFKQLSFIK